MGKRIEYSKGQVLGNLIYLREAGTHISPGGSRHRMAWFVCPYCGKEIRVQVNGAKRKTVKSCGCMTKEFLRKSFTTHGLSRHPLYVKFNVIRSRCYNPNNPKYRRYGGRGIKIHKPWLDDPVKFIEYVSLLPDAMKDGYSIDRERNGEGYFPGNLRWVDKHTQSSNTDTPARNKTGVRGVTITGKRYACRIVVRGKFVNLGVHDTLKQAAKARSDYIKENNLTEYSS